VFGKNIICGVLCGDDFEPLDNPGIAADAPFKIFEI